MAETTRTQSQSGPATLEPTQIDLETGSDVSTQSSGAAENLSAEELTTLRRENEELRRERDRQRAGNSGAQAEARRLAERLAHIEGRLAAPNPNSAATQTTTSQQLQQAQSDDLSEDDLNDALTKWLNNDTSGLSTLKQKLRPRTTSQSSTGVTEADVDRLVLAKLSDIGNKANLQSIVTQRHPEFADPKGSLARQVWDQYDEYKADPHNTLLYPDDPKTSVPMYGPDGSVKMVDARLVDRMCSDLKAQSNFQAGRDQEVRESSYGAVQSSTGQSARSNARRAVEATELLTEGELRLLQDSKIRKGWPGIPDEPKAAAKFFYNLLPAEDKAKRLALYRSRNGR